MCAWRDVCATREALGVELAFHCDRVCLQLAVLCKVPQFSNGQQDKTHFVAGATDSDRQYGLTQTSSSEPSQGGRASSRRPDAAVGAPQLSYTTWILVCLIRGIVRIFASPRVTRMDVDHPMQAAGENNEEAAVEQPRSSPPVSLNILQYVKQAQAQHGLRHSDYKRYR